MPVKTYRELIAWQKAMDLVVLVYRLTPRFPKEELYRLTQQLRKAAVSIPSNIAEGQGRRTTAEFLHFLSIASGSLNEAETQVLLGERLGYVVSSETTDVLGLSSEVGRVLNGQISSLT
jgi:four helix bundle protein